MEKNKIKYLSLYDFFGRAAGVEVGGAVYKKSLADGIDTLTRNVSNPVYEGTVILYPEWWLNKIYKR